MSACQHCGCSGFMRRHGYLKRFNENGQLALVGWRFFAQAAMVTMGVGEHFRF